MRPLRLLAAAAASAVFGLWIGVLLALTRAGVRDLPEQARPGTPAFAPASPPLAARPARRLPVRALPAALISLRLLLRFVTSLGLGLGLGLLLVVAGPFAVGMRPFVVLSGSMEPILHVGDVTLNKPISPAEARVGDVVTFTAASGRITTHRLRAVRRSSDGRFAFTTKGDANNAVERWTLPADGRLSHTVYRVPAVGRALLASHTPLGWTLLVGLPLLALGGEQIVRIWRPSRRASDAPALA
jgi:signal peptidase I